MSPVQQNAAVTVDIGPDGSGSAVVERPIQTLSMVIADRYGAVVGLVSIHQGTQTRIDVAGVYDASSTVVRYADAGVPSPAPVPDQSGRILGQQLGATLAPVDEDAKVADYVETVGDADRGERVRGEDELAAWNASSVDERREQQGIGPDGENDLGGGHESERVEERTGQGEAPGEPRDQENLAPNVGADDEDESAEEADGSEEGTKSGRKRKSESE